MAAPQQEIEQAKALAQQGNSQAAIASLSKLIQRDANNVEAWLALADVVEEPDRVEFCLQRVLSLDPGNVAAREKLSELKGASLSVGSPGDLSGQTPPGPAQPENVVVTPDEPDPKVQEGTERREDASELAAAQEAPGASQDRGDVPEISADAPQVDLQKVGSPAAEEKVAAPVEANAGFLASLGRTDFILIGLTVIAGLVLCCLITATLLR